MINVVVNYGEDKNGKTSADIYVADASTDEEYAVLKDYFDCLTSEKSLQNAADIRLLSGIILRDKAELGVLCEDNKLPES